MAWDKVQMRRERAARLECTGQFTDAEIAAAIGITPAGYAQMKMTPEYRDIIFNIKTGIISEMDAALGDDIKALREKVRNYVPVALDTIINNTIQKSDPKLAQTAAETLLAIDGRLAKVQRVGNALPEQGGMGVSSDDDAIAAGIAMAMARKTKDEESPTIQ